MPRTSRSSATESEGRPRRRFRRTRTVLCLVLAVLNLGILGSTVYAVQMLNRAAGMIPNLPEIMDRLSKNPSQIISADGQVLYSVATEYREPVRIQDVPKVVKQATLAAEDKRFFEHTGVDPWSMMRVLVLTLRDRSAVHGGGSTLTMQIAKRVYSKSERRLDRKLQDMAMATMIERMLTKNQILELYLNQVFYGSGAYGVAAAADVYFGKDLNELTIAEAALLARCVRRPTYENPFADEKKAIANRNLVLRIMVDEGMITREEFEEARNEPLKLRKNRPKTLSGLKYAPYFVDYILDQMKKQHPEIDLSTGGYRIETTLNYKVQEAAEKQVEDTVSRNKRRKVSTGAFVALDNEGRVIAMVGGADYNRNQYNVVTQGKRQPGSAFKAFVYSAAFEFGVLDTHDRISNEPYYYNMGDGSRKMVRNSDGRYGGEVSVRTAIAASINVPAVRTMEQVGPHNVVQVCRNAFGFKNRIEPYLSTALGAADVSPMEMAVAFSVFQNGGDRMEPFGIERVIGPDGQVLARGAPAFARQTLSRQTASKMDTLLRAVVTGGTGKRVRSIANARGKTGTTNEYKDAWFCGYTDRFVAVGWVGNEVENTSGRGPKWRYMPMARVFGGEVVAPMWAAIMKVVQKEVGESERDFDAREVEQVDVDVDGNEHPDVNDDPDSLPTEGIEPDATVPPLDNAPAAGGGQAPAQAEPRPVVPPPVDPRPDIPNEDTANLVFVEVCADSGQKSTIYCPERVRRPFKRGSEPKGSCPLHSGG